MGNHIFRENALAHAANPRRLEGTLGMLPPRLWLGLLAILALILIAAVWSWFGRIDSKVAGVGMLMNFGGVRSLPAQADGRIKYLNVEKGAKVVQNQVLGVIELPLSELRIKQLREKYHLLLAQYDELIGDEAASTALRQDYFAQVKDSIEESIGKLEQVRAHVRELSEMHHELHQKGVASKVEFYRVLRDAINAELDVIKQVETRLKLPLDEFDFSLQQKNLIRGHLRELTLTGDELQSKILEHQRQAVLLSPLAGTVANVMLGVGDNVNRGENVFTILPEVFDSMSLTAFVPLAEWKKIKVAQLAYVSPSNTSPQRHGYILGVVKRIGNYPDTGQTIEKFFQNSDLAKFMKRGQDVVIAIEVELIPDAGNHSGFRWTCGEPPGLRLSPGTPCEVQVVVERRPPASYVLPWLREMFLGVGRSTPN